MNSKQQKRFWNRIHIGNPDQCWPWTAYTTDRGYGLFGFKGHNIKAHRQAWTLTFGPIPDGLCVCHHCDTRNCCNPSHLFLGTLADNNADCVSKHRQARGTKTGNSKLTKAKVIAIRELLKSDMMQTEIAHQYGVSPRAIRHILTGSRWGWLEEQ